MTLLLYVDDLLIDGDEDQVQAFLNAINGRFHCKPAEWLSSENPIDHLGMNLMMDENRIYISMASYIDKILDALDAQDIEPQTLPIKEHITDDEEVDYSTANWCRSVMGCTGWLANTARPDVKYTHSRISRHLAKPNKGMYKACEHLLGYLKAHKYLCIYQELNAPSSTASQAEWMFYCDSDFAGNPERNSKRRSQSGYISLQGPACIMYGSKASSCEFSTHDIVVTAHPKLKDAHADTSSGASEIYAAGNCMNDLLHLSYVMDEMGTPLPEPIELCLDNTTAEAFMNDSCERSKLKHIDTRQYWVEELRDQELIVPEHCPTEDNLADFFTKIPPPPTFKKFRDQFMISYAGNAKGN